ncbi:glutamyl aminopeptidase [Convivina praedatoris]|uniref:Glutamyl aminopeptidase n=1 Tax=Convivina praedatoris TaxID=2880963 RepID=A0ABN8HBH4_9LACO|nr:glutamyl aminopeptidase [Convivina sp. LMG 32447]CAH1850501.1 Glutamyl aminopeptidase [Convivina sp. LMG 32447]CAH1850509.1 Glutamyl aminopeptidase [Convivina sp. LMG 32447]CAH1850702.1 Glutamyl aminopeptidase [Convivina sp. LMG 32447]
MEDRTWQRIQKYTQLQGTSGQEANIAQAFRADLTPLVDEVSQNGLGGIFGVKNNQSTGPRVMFAAHMDEVGFMVKDILPTGTIQVVALGGWNPLAVSSQRFSLFTKNGIYPIVSASVSPHLLAKDQAITGLKIEDMIFDAGFVDQAEAYEFGVRPGDFIVPDTQTTMLANQKRVVSKAWDNRFGLVTLLEALTQLQGVATPNTLIMGANTQEEVGLRSATAGVEQMRPDIYFAVDSSAADDNRGAQSHQGKLDQGTLLRVYDPTLVTPVRLKEFLLSVAEDNHIPYQYFVSQGGTDAGAAQKALQGVPSVALGVASRYIHTHETVWSIADFESAQAFVVAIAKNLDQSNYELIMGK